MTKFYTGGKEEFDISQGFEELEIKESNPVSQLVDYSRSLGGKHISLSKLKYDCNEYLGKETKWVSEKELKEFFERKILIVVSAEKFNDKTIDKVIKDRANYPQDETILVEIQKFGDDENEVIVLQLVPKEREKTKEYRKLLGMDSDTMVIWRKLSKNS